MLDSYFRTGSVIAGHYEIIRPIGTGSMGVVYHCRHLELNGLEMALKVLILSNLRRSASSDQEIYQKRFRNELTATYRVNHPHVVRTYEYLNEPGCIAYTMEYIDGGDLEHLIDSCAPLSLSKATKLLVQTCKGVQAIHEEGIIHRDLKPGNILLTQEEDVKIADFGVARIPDLPRITAAGSLLGTFAYLSPQYLEDGIGTVSSDIYALGTIAFEMITGRIPFDEAGLYKGVKAKMSREPPVVSELNPACPSALAEIVSRALHRDSEQRYQSAREMKSDLELVAKELPEEETFERLPIGRKEIFLPIPEVTESHSKHSGSAIEVIVNPYFKNALLDIEDKLEETSKNEKLIHRRKRRLSFRNSSTEAKRFWGISAATASVLGIFLVAVLATPFNNQSDLPSPKEAIALMAVAHSEKAVEKLSQERERSLPSKKDRARMKSSGGVGFEFGHELSSLDTLAAQEEEVMAIGKHRKRRFLATKSRVINQPNKKNKGPGAKAVVEQSTVTEREESKAVSPPRQRTIVRNIPSVKIDKDTMVDSEAKIKTTAKPVQLASLRGGILKKDSLEVQERDMPKPKKIPLFMKVRATLLTRFADFVEWPKDAFSSSRAPIELCILGEDPFGLFLESVVSRTTSRTRRPFLVKRFPTMNAKEVFSNCHIAYLSRSHSGEAPQLARKLGDKGVLLITENTGHGIIDFVVRERKVKFAVDRTRAKTSGLRIGSLLLDIAAEVRS